jgi:AcrR family transcriptional regulator
MSEIRRAEISQALYRCIVKRGYSNTTVRDIAKEAGMRSGLIHHYFTSKDEILEVLSEDIVGKWRERALRLLEEDKDRDPSERLRVGIDFIFLEIAGDRDLVKVFHELWNLAEHDEALNQALRSLFSRLSALACRLVETAAESRH